jgi:hypothetical protein
MVVSLQALLRTRVQFDQRIEIWSFTVAVSSDLHPPHPLPFLEQRASITDIPSPRTSHLSLFSQLEVRQ